MSSRSNAEARVFAGTGIAPRRNWIRRMLLVLDVRQSRIELARLDDHLLRDVGLSRDQVDCELRRKAWDAPEYFYDRR